MYIFVEFVFYIIMPVKVTEGRLPNYRLSGTI